VEANENMTQYVALRYPVTGSYLAASPGEIRCPEQIFNYFANTF